MFNNSSVISPLPKITVQKRAQKVNTKITQMIKKLGKRREMQILQERSQGFWMEDEVKISLDRIKLRTHRIKTMPISLKNFDFQQEVIKKRHFTFDKTASIKKKKQNKFYLPQLKQMIINRESQSSKLIIAKRRKIIHLLVLGLNRRNLGKLYQALDIVLLASYYFEKDDEERVLKSICLSLISKLHREIKTQKLSLNRKSKLNKKRKSLTVINYLTRENFMQDFIMKLRKTKLVGQFSYSDSKKHQNNVRKINAKCEVVVPRPQQIFDPALGVKNYDYVAITVDDHTNSFPYEYPKSLSEKINIFEWRQMICKLNGLLIPESKCYSFSSVIKLFYLPFIVIFILMLTFSIFRTFVTSQIGRLILISTTVFLVLVLAIKVNIEESGYTNYIQIKDKMKAYLAEWEEKYSSLNLKFRMGQNIDAIFIAFPSEEPDSSLSSSKLTEIQEVDQNDADNYTESRGYKQTQSVKGMRRTGNLFEQNGNIMKKTTFSKFASSDSKPLKRQNTLKSSCKDDQQIESVNDKVLSEKKIQNENEAYEGFLYTSQIKNKPFTQFQNTNRLFAEHKSETIENKSQNAQKKLLQKDMKIIGSDIRKVENELEQEKQRTFIYKPQSREEIKQNTKIMVARADRNKHETSSKYPIKKKYNMLSAQNKIWNGVQDRQDNVSTNGKCTTNNECLKSNNKIDLQQDHSESFLMTPQSHGQHM